MTNREFILQTVAALPAWALNELFSEIYGQDVRRIPIKTARKCCMEAHGGSCPDEDSQDGRECEAYADIWMRAEAVPSDRRAADG